MTIVAQRKRTKGWRKPPDSVCVTRPGPWSNPFKVGAELVAEDDEYGLVIWNVDTHEDAIGLFVRWVNEVTSFANETDDRRDYILDHVRELQGKTLLCWCPQPGPCHAHVLAAMADA